ncbi:primosomal protein N' [Candidatus Saccharibacteria bacterium]|nr:primosomal protein N' [Candidatus Saccharibacteria bacterium]
MHYYEVSPNKIFRKDTPSFTYESESDLSVGQIVEISVASKIVKGIIIERVKQPAYKTKPIIGVVEPLPIPKQLVNLALWLSGYYVTPLATVWQTILPSGLGVKHRSQSYQPKIQKRNRTNILFNSDQTQVLDSLAKSPSGTYLLHGVTGSGKTEIYIEMAKRVIKDNRSVIILVPEISLTSQLIAELANHFDNLLVTHSKMTAANRHLVWQEALNSTGPRVAIGPRSALFLPIDNVGLIVIDEEHEPSYKQDQSPKYSAIRTASMLGRLHKAKVILGSATPDVVDYYLAEKTDRPIQKLPKPARHDTLSPKVSLISLTDRTNFKKHRFLSDQLIEKIDQVTRQNEQVLLFHNRRGSTNISLCEDCGWIASCPNCLLPMTLHADKHLEICHICGHKIQPPTFCPKCGSADIIHKGIGTKLIEHEISKLFPKLHVARFDTDNTKTETISERYQDIYDGKIDIIIGTQTIAKGLDLPKLGLVGVIQADAGLSLPDFTSEERTFQLIAQVVGRVGRDKRQTEVIIQTYQPSNVCIARGAAQDYEAFYRYEIEKRQKSNFPPFSYLLKLNCSYKTETIAIKKSTDMAKMIRDKFKNVKVLGPTPAFYEHLAGSYRWQVVIKSSSRANLIKIISQINDPHWQYDIDPSSLL